MPLAAVDVSDGLVQILIRLYGEQRGEDLLLHQRHVIGNVQDQGAWYFSEGYVRFGTRKQIDDFNPLGTGILQAIHKSGIGPNVNNGCIVDGIEPHRIPLTSKNSPSIFRTAAINVLSETKHNVFNCR
jgi:hypothetical protein